MDIREIDPYDDAAVAEWFAVIDAWQKDARPDEPGWFEHELRAHLRAGHGPDTDNRLIALTAREGGQVVAAARLGLPQVDNRHLAQLLLVTHPAHRRRGAARALQQEAERLARAAGRTTMTAFSEELPGEEGRGVSRSVGPALGYAVAQVEVRRDIALPVDPAVVERLAQVAAQYARDYDVRTWRDEVPEDLLTDQAHLYRRMSTDVPLGELVVEEEDWDGARVRREEQRARDMGRSYFGAAAVHRPTGRSVAYTTMGVALADPSRVHQWDTLVLSEHRGRRLGTLVKLACLQRVADELPEARFLSCWNAAENAPMIRVNDALGARVNGQIVNWQKKL